MDTYIRGRGDQAARTLLKNLSYVQATFTHLQVWRALRLGGIVGDVEGVGQLHGHFDDIQAHCDYMLAGGTVVAGAHIAPERVLQGKKGSMSAYS
eukprot:1140715-Pelagomonas_calceolata.AAC.5